MAKVFGITGVVTGKMGGGVFAQRHGETIWRQYQPVVANPSTAAQIKQRARMKLMSQMSAVMAPVIAMAREGAVSSRNLFVKRNMRYTTYDTALNQAKIDLTNVKLTHSVVGLPALTSSRTSTEIAISLADSLDNFDHVVYAGFAKQADGALRYIGSTMAQPGTNNQFPGTLSMVENVDVQVYAYGIRTNSDKARVRFGEMTVTSAEEFAKLVVTRVLTENDVTLSETRSRLVSATV